MQSMTESIRPSADLRSRYSEISRLCRRADAHIMEVNPTFCSVMLSGKTEEITDLYYALDKFGCVLQYTRSGRIAVTRSPVEQVSDFLDEQERQRQRKNHG